MDFEEYKIKNKDIISIFKKKLDLIINPNKKEKPYLNKINIILNKLTKENKDTIYNDFFFTFNKNNDIIIIIDNIIKKGIMNEKYIDIYIELLIKINDKINIKDIIKNYIINYDMKLDNNNILDYEELCIYNKKKIRINNYMIIISKLIKFNLLDKDIFDKFIDEMILSIEEYYDILYNIAKDNINNINNNQKEKIINIKNNIKILKIKFKLLDLLYLFDL